jgi:hypothetical protein
MSSFRDSTGRLWEVDITIAAVKRVRSLVGIDLLALAEGDPPLITRLATDIALICDALYAVVKPQADPLGVSDEDFGESLAGETISHAYDAFWESLTDFTRGHNPAVVTAIERQRQIVRMTMEHAVRQMEAIDPKQVLTETLKTPIETLGATSGPSPAPPASTPPA